MGVRSNAPEGGVGVGVGVGTLLSSQIPQAPSNANPNEIKIQDSSAASSGLVLFAGSLLILLHHSVCEAGGACDPLIEKVLGVFIGTSAEEVNKALIASINKQKHKHKYKYKSKYKHKHKHKDKYR